MSFRLAPMSGAIIVLTIIALAVPAVFLLIAARGLVVLATPGLLVIALYMWIWLRFRPSEFVIGPQALEVLWPLKRRVILRSDIAAVRMVDRQELRELIGWGMRVGAGGLWGGFGWLWTSRRGIVQMYVSRTNDFVWIERKNDRPWLITPERPLDFVQALTAAGSHVPRV
jgi:Bacterial PH domain